MNKIYNIRKMEYKDLEQVSDIERDIFSQPWTFEDFEKVLLNPNNVYLIVEEDHTIVGYCGLWGVAGEGQINNVAVKKDFRGKGIGLAMLSELIRIAREQELNSFTLEVRESNESALHLYEKLGFVSVGTRKGFYELPKEDAIIMWLY